MIMSDSVLTIAREVSNELSHAYGELSRLAATQSPDLAAAINEQIHGPISDDIDRLRQAMREDLGVSPLS